MNKALHIALACVALAACDQGNALSTGAVDFAQADGGGAVGDLAPPPDLTPVDLAEKSCGQIVSCVVQCGLTNLACDQMCVTGASPAAIQQAGALTLCAAQNCLAGQFTDGGMGGGGTAGIFECLLSNCGSQVGMCQGLIPGAM